VDAEQQQARLRHEAEEREKISQAALLVSQESYAEADKLLDGISMAQPTVEGAAVLRAVAEWHALRQQLRQATERFARLFQVNQLDGLDVIALDYLRGGPVFVQLGDTNAYERFRQGAIARLSAVSTPFADRIVKVSLLMPANERLLETMKPLEEATAKYLVEADQAGDVFAAAWRCTSLGLLEYRRGNYLKAVELGQRCLAYPGSNAPRTATIEVILAMAYHQLGREGEAQAALAAGREIVERKYKTRLDAGGPVQGFWFDWAFAQVLLREGTALLETPPR
jgi:tetratricopeptide (TPR) repeat protein